MIKILLLNFFDRGYWKPCINQNELKRRHRWFIALFCLMGNLITLLTFGQFVWYGDIMIPLQYSLSKGE